MYGTSSSCVNLCGQCVCEASFVAATVSAFAVLVVCAVLRDNGSVCITRSVELRLGTASAFCVARAQARVVCASTDCRSRFDWAMRASELRATKHAAESSTPATHALSVSNTSRAEAGRAGRAGRTVLKQQTVSGAQALSARRGKVYATSDTATSARDDTCQRCHFQAEAAERCSNVARPARLSLRCTQPRQLTHLVVALHHSARHANATPSLVRPSY